MVKKLYEDVSFLFTRVIHLPAYVEIMTVLEEDRAGLKPVYLHPLFKKVGKPFLQQSAWAIRDY